MQYLTEIFGYAPEDNSNDAKAVRRRYLCPFRGGNIVCDPVNKSSNLIDEKGRLLLTHQTGACSVLHKFRGGTEEKPVIICPYRFLEKNREGNTIVFKAIKDKFFGKKNVVFVPEIGLGEFGRADWIICELKDIKTKEIIDYTHLEFQADATTNTRELVQCAKDFFDGVDVTKKNYSYGLNSKASIKGSSLQMIEKGVLFKSLGKKSIWVLQDTLFDILCNIYNIKMFDITDEECPTDNNLIFCVVKLKKSGERLNIDAHKFYSSSVEAMQTAISLKKPIDAKIILNAIKEKLEGGQYFTR